MSAQKSPTDRFAPDDDECWIEANIDRIERLAEGDTSDAWVFERLAQSVEEGS